MENNRNWQGWSALALAGLALVIALFGRNSAPAVTITMPNSSVPGQTEPQLPPIPPGQATQPNAAPGWLEPQFRLRQPGQSRFGPGFGERGPRGPWEQHPDFGERYSFNRAPWHHHPPFFAPFFWLFGLIRLAGVALLVWLLVTFFQGRRDRPSEG